MNELEANSMCVPSRNPQAGTAESEASAAPALHAPTLVDRFGRTHRALRVSVTDACNIRCQYCMPADTVKFLPTERLLSFEHIETLVRAAVACGIRKVRLTGGEPLLRSNLSQLVQRLRQIEGLSELALTTNGMLLPDQIEALVSAGLQRINISLDTLSAETFKQLSRRDGLSRVLAGIDSTRPFPGLIVKLNALVLRDVNLVDVFGLVEFACSRGLQMRFIEFMPLDSDRSWTQARMVAGRELRQLLEDRFGALRPIQNSDPSQPAVDYEIESTGGRVGFIDPVSQPFCQSCDRLRLTADGKLRNCLFGREEWDVAELLRDPSVDAAGLVQRMQACILAKHASHGIEQPDFQPPTRAMYQIGG